MRRGPAPKRHIDPDPVYRSLLVSQVINKVLLDGKKETARSIVYGALEIVERRVGQDPLTVLKRAVENIRPQVEVRSRRVGGSSYQVPVEVRPRRANSLAIRWLVTFARKRKENAMAERLANEILDASNNTGSAVKRREDIHKMAESNKAFAHYRW
jgi:small subunit ribosomal protein S7